MVTTEINYKGKGYTCRVLESNEGEQLTIGAQPHGRIDA